MKIMFYSTVSYVYSDSMYRYAIVIEDAAYIPRQRMLENNAKINNCINI